MTVVVTDKPELPRIAPAPDLLGHGDGAVPPQGDVVWQPSHAPAGPVSIVISGADKRVTVLRNGIEIGSAPVALATPIDRPAAYSLQSIDASGQHWVRLPLPGQDIAAPTADETGQHVTVDEGFKQQAQTVIAAGTTVLLTPDSMKTLAPATPQPLIESAPGTP